MREDVRLRFSSPSLRGATRKHRLEAQRGLRVVWVRVSGHRAVLALRPRLFAANFSAFGKSREKTGTYNEYCTIPKYPNPNDAKAALRFQSIFSRRSTKTCTTKSETDVFAQLKPTPKAMGFARAKVAMMDIVSVLLLAVCLAPRLIQLRSACCRLCYSA